MPRKFLRLRGAFDRDRSAAFRLFKSTIPGRDIMAILRFEPFRGEMPAGGGGNELFDKNCQNGYIAEDFFGRFCQFECVTNGADHDNETARVVVHIIVNVDTDERMWSDIVDEPSDGRRRSSCQSQSGQCRCFGALRIYDVAGVFAQSRRIVGILGIRLQFGLCEEIDRNGAGGRRKSKAGSLAFAAREITAQSV